MPTKMPAEGKQRHGQRQQQEPGAYCTTYKSKKGPILPMGLRRPSYVDASSQVSLSLSSAAIRRVHVVARRGARRRVGLAIPHSGGRDSPGRRATGRAARRSAPVF